MPLNLNIAELILILILFLLFLFFQEFSYALIKSYSIIIIHKILDKKYNIKN